jgi:cysteine sulfinate desulfinase/cysteine desulfurase-like protein
MNRPREVWHSSVRFSVGIETGADEIEQAAGTIAATVNRLRGLAGEQIAAPQGRASSPP